LNTGALVGLMFVLLLTSVLDLTTPSHLPWVCNSTVPQV